ncbi:Uncharacterized membrane protein YbaN, DUF454 family [Gulbenkiania indica]|uniref:Uncharacterized membrane protein YbaN, DUF454 family n=1 Tax=Gulbenkiania indica TaxID=375574 RepID=A0A0K6H052_9NEIS|nr:YbaN family protein [Gulbenkiania indica]CUA84382.1 Uncharacterized membrane protein YbaN, DUF454 family [Gulbenkiania indica]
MPSVSRCLPARWLWLCAGLVSLSTGVVGLFVPLLPTTVFILMAAACFARSSPRLHGWLLRHPRLGPAIVHWQRHRAIAPRAKRLALVSMAASFSLSLALLPSVGWVYVIVVTIWALLSLWMWRLPEMPEPVGIKVEPASSSGV